MIEKSARGLLPSQEQLRIRMVLLVVMFRWRITKGVVGGWTSIRTSKMFFVEYHPRSASLCLPSTGGFHGMWLMHRHPRSLSAQCDVFIG